MMIPGSSIGGTGPDALNPFARLVPANPRQMADRERDQHAAQREKRNRPPRRLAVEPELARQRGEHILLHLRDTLEEEIRRCRDRHTDNRPEREQHEVGATSQKRSRVGVRQAALQTRVCHLPLQLLPARLAASHALPREMVEVLSQANPSRLASVLELQKRPSVVAVSSGGRPDGSCRLHCRHAPRYRSR